MDILESAQAFDPAESLAALGELLDELDGILERSPEELAHIAPGVSGWSSAEHAFHVVLACELSLKNAAALARDTGRLVREPEERNAEGLAVLRAGAIPRGVAQAPRFVTPPKRIDLELLATFRSDVRAAMRTLGAELESLRCAPRSVPHQLLGDLSAAEWLRFAHVHTAHHLGILREILAAA